MIRETGHFEHIVSAKEAGQRLDKVVGSLDFVDSRSAAEKLIHDGFVLVDGEMEPKKYQVKEGDLLEIEILPKALTDLIPEYIPLDIVYEDGHMMVISKQPDLVVHPAEGNWTGTLVNGLLACSAELGSLQGEDRPGIVHRLDKDTSGIMLVAKSDKAQVKLQEDIKLRVVGRRYIALVHGWIGHDNGLIDTGIARNPNNRLIMQVSDSEYAKQATTSFRVLERFDAGRHDDGYTLVECKLYTGRTHQIRVHMNYIAHPIVGDQTYGARRERASRGLERQFLHSYYLDFNHPITGEHMKILDPLHDDLQELLDSLAPLSVGRTKEGEEILAALEKCRHEKG